MPANLILIGFSGTGKSSVGKYLATALSLPFVDTDQLIVDRFHMPIADLFKTRGEAIFREAEREAVAKACAQRGQVISVGGGVPVDPANRRYLLDDNLVVCLTASPVTIVRRLWLTPNAEERPMLTGSDPLARISALLAARADTYAIASIIVDTEDKTPEQVGREIVEKSGADRSTLSGNSSAGGVR